MARLPSVGSDNNTWGTVLNDYLQQSLDSAGQLVTGTTNSYTGSANTNLASASKPGIVQLAGDLGNTATSPTIVGLQGRAVYNGAPNDGNVLTWSGTNSRWQPATGGGGGGTGSIGITIDGGGSVITTGLKGYLYIPYACTITEWTILSDQSGSIVVDVWKASYASAPPTVTDTIAGTEKPTLSSQIKNQDTSLTSWTTSVAAGDVMAFKVDSVSTVTRVILSIKVSK
jgi:hypothetical protein